MKSKALPPTPHPKQWKNPRSALTENDGVFSLWNGHKPTKLRPALATARANRDFDDIGARADLFDFAVAEMPHQPPTTVRNRSG